MNTPFPMNFPSQYFPELEVLLQMGTQGTAIRPGFQCRATPPAGEQLTPTQDLRNPFPMNIIPKLKKSLRDKVAIKFAVPQKDDGPFFGVVVRLASQFVGLREIYNFETRSIQIFRLDAIGEIYNNGNTRCANRVLEQNGQLNKLRPPKWLEKCETMEDVFHQLQKRDIWPYIEVKQEEDEWSFIGPITHVEEAGIDIRHYDAYGKFEKPTPVSMEYITSVTFDGPYEKHFGNYMKMKSKAKTSS